MVRWKTSERRKVENEKIDSFLSEIINVCIKHGLSIGHEDCQGGFMVREFNQDDAEWLLEASDDTVQ
jgi:hypothetical protein